MATYKEIGHKGKTMVMQEISCEHGTYFLSKDNTVYEKAEGFPEVKDKDIIKAVKKAAQDEN